MITFHFWFEYQQETNPISRQWRNAVLGMPGDLRGDLRSVRGNTGSKITSALDWNKGHDN